MTDHRCPTCDTALVCFCPGCRGRAGGAKASPAKRRAAQQNIQATPNLKRHKAVNAALRRAAKTL